jgi:hypothetical protein
MMNRVEGIKASPEVLKDMASTIENNIAMFKVN